MFAPRRQFLGVKDGTPAVATVVPYSTARCLQSTASFRVPWPWRRIDHSRKNIRELNVQVHTTGGTVCELSDMDEYFGDMMTRPTTVRHAPSAVRSGTSRAKSVPTLGQAARAKEAYSERRGE